MGECVNAGMGEWQADGWDFQKNDGHVKHAEIQIYT